MDLLTALKTLRDDGPNDSGVGICSNVAGLLGEEIPLYRFMEGWPEHSGSRCYPVPHPAGCPLDGFWSAEDVWVGEYGAARRRLLDYMIEQLEGQSCK